MCACHACSMSTLNDAHHSKLTARLPPLPASLFHRLQQVKDWIAAWHSSDEGEPTEAVTGAGAASGAPTTRVTEPSMPSSAAAVLSQMTADAPVASTPVGIDVGAGAGTPAAPVEEEQELAAVGAAVSVPTSEPEGPSAAEREAEYKARISSVMSESRLAYSEQLGREQARVARVTDRMRNRVSLAAWLLGALRGMHGMAWQARRGALPPTHASWKFGAVGHTRMQFYLLTSAGAPTPHACRWCRWVLTTRPRSSRCGRWGGGGGAVLRGCAAGLVQVAWCRWGAYQRCSTRSPASPPSGLCIHPMQASKCLLHSPAHPLTHPLRVQLYESKKVQEEELLQKSQRILDTLVSPPCCCVLLL